MFKAIRALVHRFEWVHILLNTAGNIAFVVGSVLFFWESTKLAGTWLFVIGSAGMLVGTVGRGLVRWHEQEAEWKSAARGEDQPASRSR